MKRTFLLFVLSCFVSISTFGQTNNSIPALSKLINWLNISYSNFDVDVRSIGFSFEEKKMEEKSTNYIYIRQFNKGEYVYTERIVYKVWNKDNSIVVQLFAVQDLITIYSSQYASSSFSSYDCEVQPEDNETAFCYRSKSYQLRVTDKRRTTEVGGRNEYSITIFKR